MSAAQCKRAQWGCVAHSVRVFDLAAMVSRASKTNDYLGRQCMQAMWKKMGGAVALVGLCVTAASARVRALDYNYVTGGYEFGQATVPSNSGTISSDGPRLSASWGVAPHIAVLGAYQRLSFSNISYLSNGHTAVYQLGIEGHGQVRRNLDVLGAVEYLHESVNFSYDLPTVGPLGIQSTDNGYEVKAGARWWTLPRLEVDGTVGLRRWNCNCSNNPDTFVAAQARYYVLRDVSVNGTLTLFNHGGHLFEIAASYDFPS